MEDNHLGRHFWNFLTQPKSKAPHDDTEVEDTGIDRPSHDNNEGAEEAGVEEDGMGTSFHNDDIDLQYCLKDCHGTTADYSFIEVPDQGIAAYYSQTGYPHNMTTYSNHALDPPNSYTKEDHTGLDYGPFVEATEEGDWSAMKKFLNSHPEALTVRLFYKNGTALHYSLRWGTDREEIAACLVERMTPDDLEIKDKKGYTPLARAALYHHPKWLLQRMIDKNTNLPNIGEVNTIPVVAASWKGFKDTTSFLYDFTHKNILSPEYLNGVVGVSLLHNCINIKLFDIASELVEKFPEILLQRHYRKGVSIYPIYAFAKVFSAFPSESNRTSSYGDYILKYMWHLLGSSSNAVGSGEEDRGRDCEGLVNYNRARDFLQLVCGHLSNFDLKTSKEVVGEAMIEAAKHGNIEFITEMLKVDRELINAYADGKNMFWHAVENRQEKVFNLTYGVGDHKHALLSRINNKNNKILHFAARLPPSSVLDRVLGPSLQMQRELQWFQEVSNVAKARYRGEPNDDGLTPRQLFTKEHKDLMDAAETSMKDTAKAATTVGALIITTMFAAAFTVTAGNNNQMTSRHSSFVTEVLFNVFIACDTLSLCSSTTAILVFLGILTSRYSEDDFLFRLPRKFMIGFYALFTAIATMMTAFCSALAIALDGRSQLIVLLICMLLFVPFMFGLSSICPLLHITCNSTYGPSIFDKNTKLPQSKRGSIVCCY